jgi:hypothetical protein
MTSSIVPSFAKWLFGIMRRAGAFGLFEHDALKIVGREVPTNRRRCCMKFFTASTFADPEAAARKLVEIANAAEATRTDGSPSS